MSKHTPGPWRLSENLTASENHKGWMLLGERVAIALNINPMNDSNGDPTEEGEANAALIAAAPDMYEALELLLRCYTIPDVGKGRTTEQHVALVTARAALAKAQPTSAD